MNTIDIVRAWKDAEYRSSLSEAERAALPENPAGAILLSDEEMDLLIGGGPSNTFVHDTCPLITEASDCWTKNPKDYHCPKKLGMPSPSIPRVLPLPFGR